MKSESWTSALSPAFGTLEAREQLLLRLAYLHGLTHAKIALGLDLPLATISAQIAAAMRNLARALETPVLAVVPDVAGAA